MDMVARLERIAAGSKPCVYVIRYACGKERRIPCHSLAAANNGAARERRKIGRELIDRMTGATVRVVSVDVEETR